MKKVTLVIAMLFITGIAQSQLRGVEEYTAQSNYSDETESGVKYKTDLGYMIRYNYMDWDENDMNDLINEAISLLEENDLSFTDPDIEESTFILERSDYNQSYVVAIMMSGGDVRRAWGIDNDETTFWKVCFQMGASGIELTIEKRQKD